MSGTCMRRSRVVCVRRSKVVFFRGFLSLTLRQSSAWVGAAASSAQSSSTQPEFTNCATNRSGEGNIRKGTSVAETLWSRDR